MSSQIKQKLDYNPFEENDIVSTYTDAQAINDGILVRLGEINPDWANGLINIVTNNLLSSKGYMEKEYREDGLQDINIPNLLDLLNQAARILKLKMKNDLKFNGEIDHLYTEIMIEGPDGHKFEVWAGRNETNFYTLMLPADY